MSLFDKLAEHLRAHGFNPLGIEGALSTYEYPEHGEYAFQFIVENQRGMKFFGIPCFNKKSLIPLIDPPQYTRVDGSRVTVSEDRIENYPLPDLGWRWGWDLWYVSMLNDVDEQGWLYLSIIFRKGLHWHGKYSIGNFIRRRLWVRLRIRHFEERDLEFPENAEDDDSQSRDDELEHQAELSERPAPRKRLPKALVTTWA